MNRRAAYPDNSAEMLELIAKVTASISDRMDGQDHAIEEIRSLGREAKTQVLDWMPRAMESMKTEEREQVEAKHRHERRNWRAWRLGGLTSGPIIVLLLALILPTLLARHPLTCETMAGTWHVEDGRAFCFFQKRAP